jgi:colanic acid/amylovoran biosynthesis protein
MNVRSLPVETCPLWREELRPMRVVILPGTYHGLNMGDMAMLLVALRRLKALWPKAQITVLAYDSEPFRKFCPGIEFIPLPHRDEWLDRFSTLEALGTPGKAAQTGWKQYGSESMVSPRRTGERATGAGSNAAQFMDLLAGADLFLMTGCGALNDVWPVNAARILETFDLAIRLGVPSAMVGQGIGPLRDPALLEAAARVLPRLWFIGLREGKSGRPLLAQLGVDECRLQLTGDDAIEIAHENRPAELGREIGVNLRLADYSGITQQVVAGCCEMVRRKAGDCRARLLGLPISRFPIESDSRSLRQTFGPSTGQFDDGEELDCPFKIIARTSECRVVVTASYHAAVFALAMGIPALGIVRSEYYRTKFEGLADLFGEGCAVIDASRPNMAEEIGRRFDRLWDRAPALRPALIAAGADQVQKGQRAYESLLYLCAGSRNGETLADYSIAPR